MKAQTREDPTILAAAERQMHAWAMAQEAGKRTADRPSSPARAVSFVTISREAGAGGSEVARLVGQRLGWDVLDKNLLDQVAGRFHVPRRMLELVDETKSNWVYDVLGTWMDPKLVPHEKYAAYVTRVVQAVAKTGGGVFVGRGAQFLLPREKVLAVRIVAPEKFRVARIMQQRKLSAAKARRWMIETDNGRREFVAEHFHHQIDDPHLYDLVLNTERLEIAGAASLILAATCKHSAE
jgi:cytidylate kinase